MNEWPDEHTSVKQFLMVWAGMFAFVSVIAALVIALIV